MDLLKQEGVSIKMEPGVQEESGVEMLYTDIDVDLQDVKKECLQYAERIQPASRLPPGGKSFKCPDCNSSFPQRGVLKKHMLTHSEMDASILPSDAGDDLQIPFESKHHFKTAVQDEEEAISHSADDHDKSKIEKIGNKKCKKRINCSMCDYTTDRRSLLITHLRSHSEEKPFSCSVCEKTFKAMSTLKIHTNTHLAIMPHKCRFCERAFNSSGELVRHTRYKHTHEKPHKCGECYRAFVETSKLRRHIRSHANKRLYQCLDCSLSMADDIKLKRRYRVHTRQKPYPCQLCGSPFTQPNTPKTLKPRKKPEKCEKCPTTFGRKMDLRVHMKKLHSGEPVECKICKEFSPDRYSHKVHTKSHRGEKVYKCSVCPYATELKSYLVTHTYLHLGVKPFACDKCKGRTFRQICQLRRHKNLYHTPGYVPPVLRNKQYECEECGQQFVLKGNLRNHLLSNHSPDKEAEEESRHNLIKGRNTILRAGDKHYVELKNSILLVNRFDHFTNMVYYRLQIWVQL